MDDSLPRGKIFGDGVTPGRKRTYRSANAKYLDQEKLTDNPDFKPSTTCITQKALRQNQCFLASVTSISNYSISVMLPHCYETCIVSITDISSGYSKQLKKISDEPSNLRLQQETPSLNDLFAINQLLVCKITEIPQGKAHSIKATIDPRHVIGESMSSDLIVADMVLPGVVTSIEDTGYILDLGYDDTKGFLLKKDAVTHFKSELKLFQYLRVKVSEIKGTESKTLFLTCDLSTQDSFELAQFSQCLPGMVFHYDQIPKEKPNGLSIKTDIGKAFLHMSSKGDLPNSSKHKYAIILYTDKFTKQIFLSSKPHLLTQAPLKSSEKIKLGSVFTNVMVKSVEVDRGMFLIDIGRKKSAVSFYLSVPGLTPEDEQRAGTIIPKVRALLFSAVDNAVIFTSKEDLLERNLVSIAEVHVGMKVSCEILTLTEGGATVKINDSLKGFVKKCHFPSGTSVGRLKIGGIFDGRVFHVDENKKQVLVTMKRQLIDDPVPVPKKLADFETGTSRLGVVVFIKPNGLVVAFFNEFTGFLPKSHMNLLPGEEKVPLTSIFHLGQIITTRVARVDHDASKIWLAFQRSAKEIEKMTISPDDLAASSVVCGATVSFRMTKVKSDRFVGEVTNANGTSTRLRCSIFFTHLHDSPVIREAIVQGGLESVNKLNGGKGVVISTTLEVALSLRSSFTYLLENTSSGSLLPSDISEITPGALVIGTLQNYSRKLGLFVNLSNKIVGLITHNNLNPDYMLIDAIKDDTVLCRVVGVKPEKMSCLLSLQHNSSAIVRSPLLDRFLVDSFSKEVIENKSLKVHKKFPLCSTISVVRKEGVYKTSESSPIPDVTLHVETSDESDTLKNKMDVVVVQHGYAGHDMVGLRLPFLDSITPEQRKSNSKHFPTGASNFSGAVIYKTPDYLVVSLAKPDTDEHSGIFALIDIRTHLSDIETSMTQIHQKVTNLTSLRRLSDRLLIATLPISEKSIIKARSNFKPGRVIAKYKKNFLLLKVEGLRGLGVLRACDVQGDHAPKDTPLTRFSLGDDLSVRVVGRNDSGNSKKLEHIVTMLPPDSSPVFMTGQKVLCSVFRHDLEQKCVEITFPGIRDVYSVFPDFLPTDKHGLISKHTVRGFPIGSIQQVHICDVVEGIPVLSLKGPSKIPPVTEGSIVSGVIISLSYDEGGALISLSDGSIGFVSLVDMADEYEGDIFKHLKLRPGCKLPRVYVDTILFDNNSPAKWLCSLRPSLIEKPASSEVKNPRYVYPEELVEGLLLDGIIQSFSGSFITLRFFATQASKVSIQVACEFFLVHSAKFFVPGKVMTGKVIGRSDNGALLFSLLPQDTGIPVDVPKVLRENRRPVIAVAIGKKRDRLEIHDQQQVSSVEIKKPKIESAKKEPLESYSTSDANVATSKPSLSFNLEADALDVATALEESGDAIKQESTSVAEHGVSRKQREKEEAAIYEQERSLVDKRETEAPQSIEDFERLLQASPNSSLIWTQFMSFHIANGVDLDAARAVAERAMKAIHFREETEKLNVLSAWFAMEIMYNSDSSAISGLLSRFVQSFDQAGVYKRLIAVYRNQNKLPEAENVYITMTRKFSKDVEVWLDYCRFLFETGQADKARNTLSRCLTVFDQPKDQTSFIVRFGLLELSTSLIKGGGNIEKAKTLFYQTLSAHPSRFDIWHQFLDGLAKHAPVADSRVAFDRICRSDNLSLKRGQAFFSKWMQFEESQGDADHIKTVRERAAEFLASKGAL